MKNKDMALVVMAAGMGSRFGGMKQIAPVGPTGEVILDYSVHDALKAGFTKIVFIIKKETENVFRDAVGKHIEQIAEVSYVFQDSTQKVPLCYLPIAQKRAKPWGTAHAVLCAEEAVGDMPFAVINADDYYGHTSYKLLADHMKNNDNMCMCAFQLGNTLTDNGTVSRGICEIENGFLKSVTEHTSLDKNSGFDFKTPVSMNMWGVNKSLFPALKEGFTEFFANMQNEEKDEFFLPAVIDGMIHKNNEKITVMTTPDKWYGITYKKDLPLVKEAFRTMTKEGLYHEPLFSE